MNERNNIKETPSSPESQAWEIHIDEIKKGEYSFIIQNSSRHLLSFGEPPFKVPLSMRQKILERLNNFFYQIEPMSRYPVTQRNFSENINLNLREELKELGSSIFRYMIPDYIKKYVSQIDSEYLSLSINDVEIPWELMFFNGNFLCLKHSIGRRIPAKIIRRTVHRPINLKTKILFIANPTEDLPEAEKEIDYAIDVLNQKENAICYLLKGDEATISSLIDILEKEYFDIIHYAGHIKFDKEDPKGSEINLYDDAITAEYIFNIVETPPQMVFMNGCESATSNKISSLEYGTRANGIANAFLSLGVDIYIGTFWPVYDKIASKLSENFYGYLSEGETVGFALKNARKKVYSECDTPNNTTWASFVLYGDPRITFFPNVAEVHKELGRTYRKKGMLNEAISEYKKALAINPNDAASHHNLGFAYRKKGMFNEAISEYKKALAINPNAAGTHNLLGFAYRKKGMLEEAISEYKKALAINPDDTVIHNNLGFAYREKEMLDEAILEYKKALSINLNDPVTHKELGCTYRKKGMLDKAISEYKKALAINPDDTETREELHSVYEVKAKHKR